MVEGLDKLYENACELDLVYFPDKVILNQSNMKVNQLVDEMVLGGTVIETNLNDIIDSLRTV